MGAKSNCTLFVSRGVKGAAFEDVSIGRVTFTVVSGMLPVGCGTTGCWEFLELGMFIGMIVGVQLVITDVVVVTVVLVVV